MDKTNRVTYKLDRQRMLKLTKLILFNLTEDNHNWFMIDIRLGLCYHYSTYTDLLDVVKLDTGDTSE